MQIDIKQVSGISSR